MFRGFTAISHLLVVKRQHFENTFRHKYGNNADALFICCIATCVCILLVLHEPSQRHIPIALRWTIKFPSDSDSRDNSR